MADSLRKGVPPEPGEVPLGAQCRTWGLYALATLGRLRHHQGKKQPLGGGARWWKENPDPAGLEVWLLFVLWEPPWAEPAGNLSPAALCLHLGILVPVRPTLATQGDPLPCSCRVLALQALPSRTFLSAASEVEKHLFTTSPPGDVGLVLNEAPPALKERSLDGGLVPLTFPGKNVCWKIK